MSKVYVTNKWYTSSYGNDGKIVVGIVCPLCGNTIVYNGNYFCVDFGYDIAISDVLERMAGPCDWALSHPATSDYDRKICDALGLTYD